MRFRRVGQREQDIPGRRERAAFAAQLIGRRRAAGRKTVGDRRAVAQRERAFGSAFRPPDSRARWSVSLVAPDEAHLAAGVARGRLDRLCDRIDVRRYVGHPEFRCRVSTPGGLPCDQYINRSHFPGIGARQWLECHRKRRMQGFALGESLEARQAQQQGQ